MRASSKIAKIEIRITPENKALIEHAADIAGVSVSNYVRQRALRAARRASK